MDEPSLWFRPPLLSGPPLLMVSQGEGSFVRVDTLGRTQVDAQGVPLAAPLGAPERLVGAAREGSGVVLLAESGRVYRAREPLGSLALVSAPEQEFTGAALSQHGSERRLVGVSKRGQLYFSQDDGRTWTASRSESFFVGAYSTSPGSGSELRAGEASGFEGRFLFEALPEAWFSEKSPGVLAPIAGTMGGVRLARSTPAGIEFAGYRDQFRFVGEALVPSKKPASNDSIKPPTFGLRFARSSDVGDLGSLNPHTGRLVVLSSLGAKPHLLSGPLNEPLEERKLEGLPPNCVPRRMAASGGGLAVLCARGEGNSETHLELFAASPLTEPLGAVSVGLSGELVAARLVAGPGGRFALAGVCPPGDPGAGCEPHGVYTFVEKPVEVDHSGEKKPVEAEHSGDKKRRSARRLRQVPIPETTLPLALGFAGDGALFAIYERADQHLMVYRAMVGGDVGAHLGRGADDLRVSALDLSRLLHLTSRERRTVVWLGESEGLASLLVGSGERRFVVVLDGSLQIQAIGALPSEANEVSGVGLRILAVSTTAGRAWQSDSGGIEFEPLDLPGPLVTRSSSDTALACSEFGCLVGEELTRVGWGHRASARVRRAVHAASQEGAPTWTCRRSGGPDQTSGGLVSMPTAHDAARGNVAWSQAQYEPGRARVSVVHAVYGAEETQSFELLPPVLEPSGVAVFVSEQVEGSAALRYRIPRGETRSLEQLEVAWDNRFEGEVKREALGLGTLGAARAELGLRPGDYEPAMSGPAAAKPWLLSVSGKVIYLGLHARPKESDSVLVFGDTRGGRALAMPRSLWEHAAASRAAIEVIGAEQGDLFVAMAEGGRLVTWPESSGLAAGGPRTLHDFRLGPAEGTHLEAAVGIAYAGSAPQLFTLFGDENGSFVRAFQVDARALLSGKGAHPRRVPVVTEGLSGLRPCGLEERARTPRGVYPALGSERVTASLEVAPGVFEEMQVFRAVIQGHLDDPCLSMLEVQASREPVYRAGTPRSALLDLAPGHKSWLFSGLRSASSGQAEVATKLSTLDCSRTNP